jgi:hypothetical protein
MADFGGGIPGQVVGELKGIAVDSARAVVGAGIDILTPQTSTQSDEGKAMERGQAQVDPQAAMKQQKAAAANRRLAEVRGELQAYYEEQKKKQKQEEQVEEQKEMEEVQMKESKKKQDERQVLGRLSRQYGGTGEIGKSGN